MKDDDTHEWAARKVREVVLRAFHDSLPTEEAKNEFVRRLAEAVRREQKQIKDSRGNRPGEAGTTAP